MADGSEFGAGSPGGAMCRAALIGAVAAMVQASTLALPPLPVNLNVGAQVHGGSDKGGRLKRKAFGLALKGFKWLRRHAVEAHSPVEEPLRLPPNAGQPADAHKTVEELAARLARIEATLSSQADVRAENARLRALLKLIVAELQPAGSQTGPSVSPAEAR